MARWRRIGGNYSLSGRLRFAERVMPFDRFERVKAWVTWAHATLLQLVVVWFRTGGQRNNR